MYKTNSHHRRIVAGCLLVSSLGMFAGCRAAAPVRMPCWPWTHGGTQAGEIVTEPTPVEKSYKNTTLPAPTGELLPAPPIPTFESSTEDLNRLPPAPAPMPDEVAPAPNLQEDAEPLPRLDQPAPEMLEEFPKLGPETNSNKPVKVPGRKVTSNLPFGHVPLKDRNDTAVELKSSSSALSGQTPKVDPSRGVRRTRFR